MTAEPAVLESATATEPPIFGAPPPPPQALKSAPPNKEKMTKARRCERGNKENKASAFIGVMADRHQ